MYVFGIGSDIEGIKKFKIYVSYYRMSTMIKSDFDPVKHFLAFTHIPKCGGTSVHSCLEKMLGERYAVKSPFHPASRLSPSLWGMGGHFRFEGIPRHILNGRKPIYMTILREPVNRFLSFYCHVAARPEHEVRKAVPNFEELSPLEVLRVWDDVLPRTVRNLQTQMICNMSPESASATKAIEIIEEHYRFVATLDSMESMLHDLADFLGVKAEVLPKLNVSHIRKNSLRANREFIDEVKALNEKDILLYRYVARRVRNGKRI